MDESSEPFKRVLAPLIRQSAAGRYIVSKMREARIATEFFGSISTLFHRSKSPATEHRLCGHSPPAQSPRLMSSHMGEALGSLEKIRASGKAIKIGISCEDVDSGLLALDDRACGSYRTSIVAGHRDYGPIS